MYLRDVFTIWFGVTQVRMLTGLGFLRLLNEWIITQNENKERSMQAQGIGQSDQGCTCSEWAANMPQLRNLVGLGVMQGQEYQGTPFRFCPWCEQALARGVTNQRDETLLATYRQRINEDFFGEDEWGTPQMPNMLVTARLIAGYRQAGGDLLGTLDLMLTFVEAGTRFTNDYGDIDEPFYEGLELMLDDFQKLLLVHPNLYEEGDLAQRLAKLRRDAGPIGWGYGDYVTECIDEIRQHFNDG